MKLLKDIEQLKYIIDSSEGVIIYGAGLVSSVLVCNIMKFGTSYGNKIFCIAVEDMSENPDMLLGVPVCLVNEVEKCKYPVIIATLEKIHESICSILESYNFQDVYGVSNILYAVLRKTNPDFQFEMLQKTSFIQRELRGIREIKKQLKFMEGKNDKRMTALENDIQQMKKETAIQNRMIAKIRSSSMKKECRRMWLMGIPEHTNIGDSIITLAVEKFLERNLSDYEVIKVSTKEYFINKEILYDNINREDIVLITGGGFLGDLWFDGELVLDVLKLFRHNKCIILPQSLWFIEESGSYRSELGKLLSSHDNVKVCFREKYSYVRAKDTFGGIEQHLIPDMALYLQNDNMHLGRQGIALCLRSDKESILTDEDKQFVVDFLEDKKETIVHMSMHTDEFFADMEKEDIVAGKLREISTYELVVTDTLHCMISCVITGTPCIALNNLTSKVSGVYEWVKSLDYVRYIDTAKQVPMVYGELQNIKGKDHTYMLDLTEYWKKLKVLIVND